MREESNKELHAEERHDLNREEGVLAERGTLSLIVVRSDCLIEEENKEIATTVVQGKASTDERRLEIDSKY